MPRHRNLQFVWPKDGYKGRNPRGFMGRLNNIVTGKGPDIFLQHKRSREPILPDQWQNWDSYRDPFCHIDEEAGPVSRGYQRYDPYTRTYKEWATPEDWWGNGTDGLGISYNGEGLPRFTQDEARLMRRARARGRVLYPSDMGDEWTTFGPKRFRAEYDHSWRSAHRQADNIVNLVSPFASPNRNMRMHQQWASDPQRWILQGLI